MSDSSEKNPIPEEIMTDDQASNSSRTMLLTMLLLTTVFLFTSFSLLNQSLQAHSAEGNPIIEIKAVLESYRSLALQPSEKRSEAAEPEAAQTSPFDGIRNMMSQTDDTRIRWPKLKITGAGKKSIEGTEDFAIINGDRVHPGEFAGKVKLVEVRSYDVVVVEYRSERRVLTVGLQD